MRCRLYLMANPMAQAAISLESHPGGHVYLYERAPVGATRVNCGLIMVARSATLGSWLVGHSVPLGHTWLIPGLMCPNAEGQQCVRCCW